MAVDLSEIFGLFGLAVVAVFLLRVIYGIARRWYKISVPKWEVYEHDLIFHPVKKEIHVRGGRNSRRQAVWDKSLQQITKLIKTRSDADYWRQGIMF